MVGAGYVMFTSIQTSQTNISPLLSAPSMASTTSAIGLSTLRVRAAPKHAKQKAVKAISIRANQPDRLGVAYNAEAHDQAERYTNNKTDTFYSLFLVLFLAFAAAVVGMGKLFAMEKKGSSAQQDHAQGQPMTLVALAINSEQGEEQKAAKEDEGGLIKVEGASMKLVPLLAAGLVGIHPLVASPAMASQIDLADKRAENKNGLQLIYEARDLENDNRTKDAEGPSGFALQKLTPDETRLRAKEAASRLSGEVIEYVNKKYWTQASNSLRRAVYTLRFDINNLVVEKGGAKKSNSLQEAKDAKVLYQTIEKLDFAIRSKDQYAAQNYAADVAKKADTLLKELL